MREVRTRYAPSPTGYMHIGNLKAAMNEYLVAKSLGGKFILRIEDTDEKRLVEGAVDVVYRTLRLTGLLHDEGPDIGGGFGPYVQSERRSLYMDFAKQLVSAGKAYYCFCSRERLETLVKDKAEDAVKYDRHCLKLSHEEIERRIFAGEPFVIRQLIPEGKSSFHDEVYGDIRMDNSELDDQILMKSDGFPTYNFANVIDDHLMKITHVVRGAEYLSSTPKYNLLYEAFDWEIPVYIHGPLLLNEKGEKISKRRGDASIDDLLGKGFLPETIVNYTALLGWSPEDNREFFTLDELVKVFKISGLSKSPASVDLKKMAWMNSEYIKKMDSEKFYLWVEPVLKQAVKCGVNLKKVSEMVQTRIELPSDIFELVDFVDNLPEYEIALYENKKMKTDLQNSGEALEKALEVLAELPAKDYVNSLVYEALLQKITRLGIKNSQMLWPVRTALSGKPSTPCGATEIAELLGKEETLIRIKKGIEKLRTK